MHASSKILGGNMDKFFNFLAFIMLLSVFSIFTYYVLEDKYPDFKEGDCIAITSMVQNKVSDPWVNNNYFVEKIYKIGKTTYRVSRCLVFRETGGCFKSTISLSYSQFKFDKVMSKVKCPKELENLHIKEVMYGRKRRT
jgi:hypothetical protein